MKKAIISSTMVFLLILGMIGCTGEQEPIQSEVPEETQVIEESQAVETVEPLETSQLLTQDLTTVKELTTLDFIPYFEKGYDSGEAYREIGINENDLIMIEYTNVELQINIDGDIEIPSDLEDQYRVWRLEAHPDTSTEQNTVTTTTTTTTTTQEKPGESKEGTTNPSISNNDSLGIAPGSGTDANQFVVSQEEVKEHENDFANSGLTLDPSNIIYGD